MFPTSAHHPAPENAAAEAPAAADDPRPQPPVEPQLEDCCGSGCVVCVLDLYEEAMNRYRIALTAWQQRQGSPEASVQSPFNLNRAGGSAKKRTGSVDGKRGLDGENDSAVRSARNGQSK